MTGRAAAVEASKRSARPESGAQSWRTIPKPFSRVRVVYSEPIHVPREGGRDEDWLAQIQSEMDRTTQLAEDWSVSA